MAIPCKSLFSAVALLALAATGASPAFAATGAALARDVTVQVYELRMEVAMMTYDETSDSYAKDAAKILGTMAAPMDALVKELAAKDATAGATARGNWQAVNGALAGGGEWGEGILKTGYDSRVSAEFDDNSQQIMFAVDKAWSLTGSAATPEARTLVLAARTVANYVQVSASPFGAYTSSFNSEDTDLNKLVPRVDAALGELLKKYAADSEKSARLKRVNAKWQFIRTTILKAGKQATPYIVYKHGGDIIDELKTFN